MTIVLAATAFALLLPANALAEWQEPVGGDQPINVDGTVDALFPSLASVSGVPYIAWQEAGGSAAVVRVSRLNAAGTAWVPVGGPVSVVDPPSGGSQPSLIGIGAVPYVAFLETDDDGNIQVRVARLAADETTWERVGETDNPAKPINESDSQDSLFPSLAEIGGVPYVAWSEFDGVNLEIRVARLNASGTGWDKVGATANAASPINQSSSAEAREPSLAAIAGVPYVAWREFDGGNFEIRVARLNGSGTGWDKVGQADNPAFPINESGIGEAREPSLAGIGGVPYVAWRETPPVTGSAQVRVARLNATETGWEKVAGGISPINHSSAATATDPSLIGVDGTPYVAWSENSSTLDAVWVAGLNASATAWEMLPDSDSPVAPDVGLGNPSLVEIGGVPWVGFRGNGLTNSQTRVSRLEPELEVAAAARDTGATLIAAVEGFGFPYEVGFEYGVAPGFDAQTATQTTSGEVDLITEEVSGLLPSTTYDFRAFALAGVPAPKVLGATDPFTTSAAGTSACDAATADLAAAKTKLKKKRKKLRKAKEGGDQQKIKRAKRAVKKAKRAVAAADAVVDAVCP